MKGALHITQVITYIFVGQLVLKLVFSSMCIGQSLNYLQQKIDRTACYHICLIPQCCKDTFSQRKSIDVIRKFFLKNTLLIRLQKCRIAAVSLRFMKPILTYRSKAENTSNHNLGTFIILKKGHRLSFSENQLFIMEAASVHLKTKCA